MDMTVSTMPARLRPAAPAPQVPLGNAGQNSWPGLSSDLASHVETAAFAIFMSEFRDTDASVNRLGDRSRRMDWRGGILRAGRGAALAAMLSPLTLASARAEMLHATYSVSLVGLTIGTADVSAKLTPNSYSIEAQGKISGLAYIFSHARGASSGQGAIFGNRVAPASFATMPPTRR
jgi:hypothetical protein